LLIDNCKIIKIPRFCEKLLGILLDQDKIQEENLTGMAVISYCYAGIQFTVVVG